MIPPSLKVSPIIKEIGIKKTQYREAIRNGEELQIAKEIYQQIKELEKKLRVIKG